MEPRKAEGDVQTEKDMLETVGQKAYMFSSSSSSHSTAALMTGRVLTHHCKGPAICWTTCSRIPTIIRTTLLRPAPANLAFNSALQSVQTLPSITISTTFSSSSSRPFILLHTCPLVHKSSSINNSNFCLQLHRWQGAGRINIMPPLTISRSSSSSITSTHLDIKRDICGTAVHLVSI